MSQLYGSTMRTHQEGNNGLRRPPSSSSQRERRHHVGFQDHHPSSSSHHQYRHHHSSRHGDVMAGAAAEEEEDLELDPAEVLPTLRHVRDTLSSFQSLRGPPAANSGGGGYDEEEHEHHHHRYGQYFEEKYQHDDHQYQERDSKRPRSSGSGGDRRPTQSSVAGSSNNHRISATTVAEGTTIEEEFSTIHKLQSKTAHWATLARQGNAEMNDRRSRQLLESEELDYNRGDGGSRPHTADGVSGSGRYAAADANGGGRPVSNHSRLSAAGGSRLGEESSSSAQASRRRKEEGDAANANTTTKASMMKLREEAELRTVTQLRTQLETLNHTHNDELKVIRLKHQEELAEQRAQLIAEQRKKVDEAQKRMERQLVGEKTRAEEEAARSKSDMEALARQLHTANNSVAEAEANVKSLKKLVHTHEKEVKTQTTSANEGKKKIAELTSELDRMVQEHERIKSSLGRNAMQLTTELDHCKRDLMVARDDNMHLRKALDVLKEEKAQLEEDFDRLEKKMEEKYVEMDKQLEAGAKKWKQTKISLETKINASQGELQRAQTALASTEHDLNEYKLQTKDVVNNLKAQGSALEKDLALAQERLQQTSMRLEDKEHLVSQLEAECFDSRPKLERLLHETADLRAKNEELGAELQREKERAKSLEKAKSKREVETSEIIGNLRTELASKEKKLAQLAGCRDTNQELARVRAELTSAKETIEGYKSQIGTLQQSNQLAAAQVQAAQAQTQQVIRQVASSTTTTTGSVNNNNNSNNLTTAVGGATTTTTTAHERSHMRQHTESSAAKRVVTSSASSQQTHHSSKARLAPPPPVFPMNSAGASSHVPLPPHVTASSAAAMATRTSSTTAAVTAPPSLPPPNEEHLQDPDLRALEIRKRQLQEEAHWSKCKAHLEAQSDQLLAKIRENMKMFDSSED